MLARAILLLLSLNWVGLSLADATDTHRITDPTLAEQYIEEVLARHEFQTTIEVEDWRYMHGDEEWRLSDSNGSILGDLGALPAILELVLWLIIISGIVIIAFYITKRINLSLPDNSNNDQFVSIPTVEHKLESSQSLPSDILATVRQLWHTEQHQAAMSLLYRGALATLIQRDGLEVPTSATEGECLRLVRQHQTVETIAYFAKLTRLWQSLAYAQHLPDNIDIEALCEEWQQYF